MSHVFCKYNTNFFQISYLCTGSRLRLRHAPEKQRVRCSSCLGSNRVTACAGNQNNCENECECEQREERERGTEREGEGDAVEQLTSQIEAIMT